MFLCVPLALASPKERSQQLIIFGKFLLFSFHSSRWLQDSKSGQNVQAMEGVFGLESISGCVSIRNP